MLIAFSNRQTMLGLEWETVVFMWLAGLVEAGRGQRGGALLTSLLLCFMMSCDPLLCAGQF